MRHNILCATLAVSVLALGGLTLSSSVSAEMEATPVQQTQEKNAQINFEGFMQVSGEVYKLREQRRVDVETFLKMVKEDNTMILDTRTKANYDAKHIKGAKHLNFSDFTADKLAKVIPNKDTRILIYCNNNFTQNSEAFAMKAPPLALNIPTFINLYGYGYKNIYELGPAVDEKNSGFEFEGTDAL